MIAFRGTRCLELAFFPREVVPPISRSKLSLPGKLSFARVTLGNSLSQDSGLLGSSTSSLVSPSLLAAEKEEAKAVLTLFLKKQGLSDTAVESTLDKSDQFIDHLVSRLPSLHKSRYRVGRELTTLEIRDALVPYLESFVEEHGGLLVDFVKNFQNRSDEGKPIRPVRATKRYRTFRHRVQKALQRVHERGPDGTLHPNILYLMELGLDLEQIDRMARLYPSIPFLSVEQKIKPAVKFLLDLGVQESNIPTVLAKTPHLCGFSLSEKLNPSLAFLESLGVDRKNWVRVLSRHPMILGHSRKKIVAVVGFLYEMGVSDESIGRILTKFPNISSCSVEDNLRPTAEFFHSLGVDVAVLLHRHPNVFGLSIKNHLKPITEFFLGNGFSTEDVAEMITKFGGLCNYKLATLAKKFDYFLTLGYPLEELVKCPVYFACSLEGRIKPRFELVKESGLKLSVSQVLLPTDHNFKARLEAKIMKMRSGKLSNRCN